MQHSVFIEQRGCLGRIVLNSAPGGTVLSIDACEQISRTLNTWLYDDAIHVVLIDQCHQPVKFCAGSDMRLLAEAAAGWGDNALRHIRAVYSLFYLISSYPKPCVAISDGNTCGRGYGIFGNARYRIATERTVLSFPETGLGYIPDGGATWHLANLPGELGTWLALTGAKLRGADVLAAGIATHFCDRVELENLKKSLSSVGATTFRGLVSNASLSFSDDIEQMDELFAGACATRIRYGLDKKSKWADRQATKLDAKSPLSIKIALRQVRTGRFLSSVRDALKIEYRIASRLVHSYNFREGVRAQFLDQDYDPRWKPGSLVRVTYDMVARYFSPLDQRELSLPITEPHRPQPLSKKSA